jgi:hypothetical protein
VITHQLRGFAKETFEFTRMLATASYSGRLFLSRAVPRKQSFPAGERGAARTEVRCMAKRRETTTVVPAPSYNIPASLAGMALFSHVALANDGIAGVCAVLGSFLAFQASRVKFVFDDEALEVVIGENNAESENKFVGGRNRWAYKTFTNCMWSTRQDEDGDGVPLPSAHSSPLDLACRGVLVAWISRSRLFQRESDKTRGTDPFLSHHHGRQGAVRGDERALWVEREQQWQVVAVSS